MNRELWNNNTWGRTTTVLAARWIVFISSVFLPSSPSARATTHLTQWPTQRTRSRPLCVATNMFIIRDVVYSDAIYLLQEEQDPHFEPVIKLTEQVETKTNEEDEEAIFKMCVSHCPIYTLYDLNAK